MSYEFSVGLGFPRCELSSVQLCFHFLTIQQTDNKAVQGAATMPGLGEPTVAHGTLPIFKGITV